MLARTPDFLAPAGTVANVDRCNRPAADVSEGLSAPVGSANRGPWPGRCCRRPDEAAPIVAFDAEPDTAFRWRADTTACRDCWRPGAQCAFPWPCPHSASRHGRSAGPGTRGADEEDATPAAGTEPRMDLQLGRFGGLTSQRWIMKTP